MTITGKLRIDHALATIREAAQQGLYLAGEHVLNESNAHVPLEYGDLQGSGVVSQDGDTVAVSYDTPYAARQHEEMGYHHDAGRNAKFLENAINSDPSTLGRIVADSVRGRIGS